MHHNSGFYDAILLIVHITIDSYHQQYNELSIVTIVGKLIQHNYLCHCNTVYKYF